MSMRTAELVSEWDTVPFSGGYDGLWTLTDQDFSGAVIAGSARLFMLNGKVIGVLDGDIESFEDASATARRAPHDSLPLLVVMQARADSPRAQYYTEDTPLSDVDQTLEDGKFTGFVELSENVLSGDYYLVYHQGRSMSVAWVGSSQRLITDDEAYEQADGEVGIYEVMPAEIDIIELPDRPDSQAGGAGQRDTSAVADRSDPPVPETDSDGRETDTPSNVESDNPATGRDSPADAEPDEPAPTDSATGADSPATVSEPQAASDGEPASRSDSEPASSDDSPRERGTTPTGPPGSKAAGASQGTAVDTVGSNDEAEPTEPGEATETQSVSTDEPDPTTTQSGPTQPESTAASQSDPTTPDPTPESEAASQDGTDSPTESGSISGALETRSIPSLDPERSSSPTSGASERQSATPDDSGTAQSTPTEDTQPTQGSTATEQPTTRGDTATRQETTQPNDDRDGTAEQADTQPEPSAAASSNATAQDSTSELEATVQERNAEITELESELRALSTKNEELSAERDRLQSELEEARAEIQRLRDEAGDTTVSGGKRLSAGEAIDGTNLFVRYHSKSEATLSKAKDGTVDREAVDGNLRLEYHTQFDGDDATVDGTGFETFLQESIQYRFADWLVRSLLYEIRQTGHENAMSVLYEAIPKIDRAELNGNVTVTYTEDGQEHRSQEQFDVVVRDRMGNPLVVANINDSREPATNGQMTDIIRDAERVGNASDSLAAAFLVTSSFFEPEALETAEEATASGLFSRDKNKSFVNLSRRGGYHLCLLEARNKEFHLAVPEL